MHSAFSVLASERRSTGDVRRRPGYKIWRLFKFEFSEVNINSQCLVLNVLNDRSIDENLKRRQILKPGLCRTSNAVRKREKMRNAHISEMRSNGYWFINITGYAILNVDLGKGTC